MIALDVSRLLSRADSATPTGIDRVELAYAQHLITQRAPYCFAARNALGGIGMLPAVSARQFIAGLGELWRDGSTPRQQRRVIVLARRLRLAALVGEPPLRAALRGASETPRYLLVSHQNLDRAAPIARLKVATGARFLCLIHDLIPLDFPELTRPGQTRRHQRRIAAVEAIADAVITNSAATRDALRKYLVRKAMPIAIASLGADLPSVPPAPTEAGRYFIAIGTIETRKNQLLLLDIWQRLAAELGDRTPRLVLVGRRGFGGERIDDRLAALRGRVIEHSGLPDIAMAGLLRGAHALLLPSLAEGFGLPVVEALTLGVPVLCSDLPALRESGGDIPEYLDPSDCIAWHRGILDFADESPRRQAQLARLAKWSPPRWSEHFAIVERLIADLG